MSVRLIARTALVVLAVAASGAMSACGTADAPAHDPARSILEAYRVLGMLSQAAPIITDALETNLPAQVSKADRARIKQAVRHSFAADKLMQAMIAKLHAAADKAGKPQRLAKASKALDSKLTQRMSKLEDASAGKDFGTGFAKFRNKPLPDSAKPRMQKVKTLAHDLRLVRLQIGFNVGMIQGMVRARNAAAPKGYTTSEDVLKRMLAETRDSLGESLDKEVPLMLYYAYRSADDKSVTQYAKLQSNPDVQWVNEQVAEALESTLADASQQVGKRYRASAPADKS